MDVVLYCNDGNEDDTDDGDDEDKDVNDVNVKNEHVPRVFVLCSCCETREHRVAFKLGCRIVD